MEPKTILITGGSSIIAETLIEILLNETDPKLSIISSNADSFRTNERLTANKVDLVDIKNLKSFCYNEKPDVIVNTASVNDLNLRGVSGPVTFLLTDSSYSTGEIFPITVSIANENLPTATNTVTTTQQTIVNHTKTTNYTHLIAQS